MMLPILDFAPSAMTRLLLHGILVVVDFVGDPYINFLTIAFAMNVQGIPGIL